MSNTVLACRACDSTQIQRRSGRDGKAPPGTWHCNECGADFDAPRRRERRDGKTDTAPRGTLAAVLEEMDPDDLVADGGVDDETPLETVIDGVQHPPILYLILMDIEDRLIRDGQVDALGDIKQMQKLAGGHGLELTLTLDYADDFVADGGLPLRPAPEDLDEQTIQRGLYCREHRVVKVVDKLGRPVCLACIVAEVFDVDVGSRRTMTDGLRCPKCYTDFDDEDAFREHYRQHLDGAPTPEAVVERARHFEGEWTAIEEAWRDADE